MKWTKDEISMKTKFLKLNHAQRDLIGCLIKREEWLNKRIEQFERSGRASSFDKEERLALNLAIEYLTFGNSVAIPLREYLEEL